jgi:transcriptional regulator with XRE-family HTH domain
MTPVKPGRFKFSTESLIEIRKQMKLTQKQMADLLPVELNTLWRWEKGNSPPDANSLAKIYSLAMERGITPNFFRGKGMGRTRLIVMWDLQNLGVSASDVSKADAWIKDEINKRFSSVPNKRFKAFAHTSQSAASDELNKMGWRVFEDTEDIDEDLIQQSLSDCGQNPTETVLVIITKDSDYSELIRDLSDKGVRVYLIAPEDSSKKLISEVGSKRIIKWNVPNNQQNTPNNNSLFRLLK